MAHFEMPGPAANSQARKPRVLAVDDQRDAVRLLQIRLQNAGMECFTCLDGSSALEFLSTETVDVIILDVMMPQMDGFEVCRRIKGMAHVRDIPILFVTARLEIEDKVRGLEVGAHDYLSKPVEQQELLARTRAALRVKYLQDELKTRLDVQQRLNEMHQQMLSQHWETTFGQLAASLAHEINNPLAAALVSIQLLAMEEETPPKLLSRLELIDKSLQRAGHKLRSLLLIAQNVKYPQRVRLSGVLEDTLALINFQLVMNKVTLRTNLDSTVAWEGNPSELARAILYLLNNALEAVAGVQSAEIQIELEQSENGPVIYIRDNGCGLPQEPPARLFEPFFTTKGQPHSGIGLHLAQEIIHHHEGKLQLKPLPGRYRTEAIIALARSAPRGQLPEMSMSEHATG